MELRSVSSLPLFVLDLARTERKDQTADICVDSFVMEEPLLVDSWQCLVRLRRSIAVNALIIESVKCPLHSKQILETYPRLPEIAGRTVNGFFAGGAEGTADGHALNMPPGPCTLSPLVWMKVHACRRRAVKAAWAWSVDAYSRACSTIGALRSARAVWQAFDHASNTDRSRGAPRGWYVRVVP